MEGRERQKEIATDRQADRTETMKLSNELLRAKKEGHIVQLFQVMEESINTS